MAISVNNLVQQAEENRIIQEQQSLREMAAEEERIRNQVAMEVENFLKEWLNDMKANRTQTVKKALPLEEAETYFTSLPVARELLSGKGLGSRIIPQKTRGILWWKRVEKPAKLIIYPARKREEEQ